MLRPSSGARAPQGDKSGALEQARIACTLSPSLFAGHYALATALFENELYAQAAREFQSLLARRPRSQPLQQAFILSLYRQGRLAEAEAAAREARRSLPADPLFDLWSARLDTRLGRRDQALADLEEGRRNNGPMADWLRQVEDLKSLRDDPRARTLAGE